MTIKLLRSICRAFAAPLFVLVAVLLGVVSAGCEGPTGPWGDTGPPGPDGTGLVRHELTTAEDPEQAEPNSGYIANSSAQVTLILPAEAEVGDIAVVSEIGSGGFKVTQHAGHSISTMAVSITYGIVSPPREEDRQWSSVASSAHGRILAAVCIGSEFGDPLRIYTSEPRTSVGEEGALLGVQGSSVWLMYAGGGTGSVVTYAGDLAIE